MSLPSTSRIGRGSKRPRADLSDQDLYSDEEDIIQQVTWIVQVMEVKEIMNQIVIVMKKLLWEIYVGKIAIFSIRECTILTIKILASQKHL